MILDSQCTQKFPLWRADSHARFARYVRYVWMEAVSGKNKLRIQKYLNTSRVLVAAP